MRVLIVEDDLRLASAIGRGCGEAGIGVVHAADGEEALAAARAGSFDVIVLDVMLPGRLNGFEVAAELRGYRVTVPILILTSRDAVADRVRGLEMGADDYLLKPFAFEELLARLRALARRHLPERGAVLRLGPLSVDTARKAVSVGKREVQLTAQEFSLLEYFMLHPAKVLNREQILEHAWSDGAVQSNDSNPVDVYVARLRRKLMSAGSPDPFITVRGAGYRLEMPDK
jgi:two-component system OmpR family response regulator